MMEVSYEIKHFTTVPQVNPSEYFEFEMSGAVTSSVIWQKI